MFKILARGFWEWGLKAIVNIKIWAGNTAEEGIICMMFSRKKGRWWTL